MLDRREVSADLVRLFIQQSENGRDALTLQFSHTRLDALESALPAAIRVGLHLE